MTKIKIDKVPNVKSWIKKIEDAPYYSVAIQILKKRNNYNPMSISFTADLFETFHKIAKVDNKIHKGRKKK